MKDYMIAHTFKSEEHRTKHFEASSQLTLEYMREHMKSDSAAFQMNWANPDEMVTYCWWKAESPAAIISMLGEMAELYHNDIREMPMVANVTDQAIS